MTDIPLSSKQKSLALLHRMVAEIWSAHREKDHEAYNECEEVECAWCENTREALAILEQPDETPARRVTREEAAILERAFWQSVEIIDGRPAPETTAFQPGDRVRLKQFPGVQATLKSRAWRSERGELLDESELELVVRSALKSTGNTSGT